ncbi:MAG: hypothetical protein AMXMBFR13_22090 [Phycisphaerae bacterium]
MPTDETANRAASPMHRVRVVLVRPHVAGNIGAIARAMENFDAGELVLVAPEVPPTHREAVERSTHGQHRLRSARVVDTLEEALAGAVFAIGTSRRRGPVHQQREYTSRDLGKLAGEHVTSGDVALLLGTENNGLSREDLLACDAVVQIPAWEEYPTLNLSHAATVCLYEIFNGLMTAPEPQPPSRPERHEPADLALMERLMVKLQHALLTVGYLNPDKPDHLMFPLRAILSRAGLTRGEAQILIGLAQQIDEFARYGSRRRRQRQPDEPFSPPPPDAET